MFINKGNHIIANRFGNSSTPRETRSASNYPWSYLVNSSSLLQAILRKIAATNISKSSLSLGIFERASNWLNPPIGPPHPTQ